MIRKAFTIMLLIFIGSVCAGIVGGFGDGAYFAVLILLFTVFGALMLLGTDDNSKSPQRTRYDRIKVKRAVGDTHPA